MHYIIHSVCLLIIAALIHQLRKRGDNLYHLDEREAEASEKEAENSGTLTEDSHSRETTTSEDIFSSVWCHGKNANDRICQFHNVCFHPEANQFIFFLDEKSVTENLPENDFKKSILDLSSVADHNAFYLTLSVLPSSVAGNFPLKRIDATTLAFSRFKPDNLMHVLHDDILPLHRTLTLISSPTNSSSKFNVSVLFLDARDQGEYMEFYEAFLSSKPIYRKDLNISLMTCFSNIFIGLSKTTTWYHYGFTEPQSPIPGLTVTASLIRKTTDFLLQHLTEGKFMHSKQGGSFADYVVLLSRTENRLITNEIDLSAEIAKELKIKVVILNSDQYPISEMIHLVSASVGVIGMHGALMSMIMFLKPGSFVVELFPFAIPPENYTPYKTLSDLQGMRILYRSWANRHDNKTIPHPDWPAELGGIQHLSIKEQSDIISETRIKRHLCCDNPSWLFRIYQDTVVTISELLPIISAAMIEASELKKLSSENNLPLQIFPDKVSSVMCKGKLKPSGEITLHISWQPSWNLQFLTYDSFHYEVLVQTALDDELFKYVLTATHLELPFESCILWIRAVLNEFTPGPYVNLVDCSI